MKLLAFLNKPNDQAVLEAAVLHYTPSKIHIFVPLDNERLDKETVNEWHVVRDNPTNASVTIHGYEMNSWCAMDIVQAVAQYAQEGDAVALPTTVRRAFMDAVPLLRAAGMTTVEIPDGLNSAFGLLGHALAVRLTLNPFSLVKCVRALIKTPRCRADISFYPFFPLKSAFARVTLPAAPQRISRQKIDALAGLIHGERPCLVGLSLLSAETIAKKLGIRQYVATTKQKKLIVDGHHHDLPFYLCTEEVLACMKPSFTIGYASNAVVMAKILHADRPTALVTGILNFRPTIFYETYFARVASSIGVRVFSVKSLSPDTNRTLSSCEGHNASLNCPRNSKGEVLNEKF
jgi:hypothetical protein